MVLPGLCFPFTLFPGIVLLVIKMALKAERALDKKQRHKQMRAKLKSLKSCALCCPNYLVFWLMALVTGIVVNFSLIPVLFFTFGFKELKKLVETTQPEKEEKLTFDFRDYLERRLAPRLTQL